MKTGNNLGWVSSSLIHTCAYTSTHAGHIRSKWALAGYVWKLIRSLIRCANTNERGPEAWEGRRVEWIWDSPH